MTNLTLDEMQKYLKQLSEGDFCGEKYDLFLHNCNVFSNQVRSQFENHSNYKTFTYLPFIQIT